MLSSNVYDFLYNLRYAKSKELLRSTYNYKSFGVIKTENNKNLCIYDFTKYT